MSRPLLLVALVPLTLLACGDDAGSPAGGSPSTGGAGNSGAGSSGGGGTTSTSTVTSTSESSTTSTSTSSGEGGSSPSNGPDATAAVRFTGGDICYRHLHQIAAAPDGWVVAGWVMPNEADLNANCSIVVGGTAIQASHVAKVRTDFVAKLSPAGEVSWVVPLDPHSGSGVEDVAVDVTGDIHLVGRIHYAGQPLVYWMKLDAQGQPLPVDSNGLFPKTQHVVITPSGDLIFGASDRLVRTTADGVVLATSTPFEFGVTGDTISGLALSSDNFVFLTAPAYDITTDSDLALAKYDLDLFPVWSKTVGGANSQDVHDVASDGAAGAVIVGNFDAQLQLGATTLSGATGGYEPNGFVARIDSSGEPVITIGFGNNVASSCCDGPTVATWPNGDWVVGGGGSFKQSNGMLDFGAGPIPVVEDAFLARWAADGTPLWGRVFQGSARINEVAVGPDGSIGVVGNAATAMDFGTGPLPEPNSNGDVFFASFPAD